MPQHIGARYGMKPQASALHRETIRSLVQPPLRHDAVGAVRFPATTGEFRNEEQRDNAYIISEVHGVVHSVIHPRHPEQRWLWNGSNEARSEAAPPPHPPPPKPTWGRRLHQAVPTLSRVEDAGPRRTRHMSVQPQEWQTYPRSPHHLHNHHRHHPGRPMIRSPIHWRTQVGRDPLANTANTRPIDRHDSWTRERMVAGTWSQSSPLQQVNVERPTPIATPPAASVARLREVSKRVLSPRPTHNEQRKKSRAFDKLDLLCSATLEMGPLHDNPMGCSCPKSKCVALYCDCFKAGRRCNPSTCSCLDCKNTLEESGPTGARTKAIRNILARNPRAFTTAGVGNPLHKLPPGEVACNCIRSRCLKLYCTCFQAGKACSDLCTCVSCLNLKEDPGGHRQQAIQQCLEKRPDAFKTRVREPGLGCACKNNRCIRKYCECFRNGRACTAKCSCRLCLNITERTPADVDINSTITSSDSAVSSPTESTGEVV